MATFRQWPGSLPHSYLHLLGWKDLARAGAAGLLSLREVLMGVNELSLEYLALPNKRSIKRRCLVDRKTNQKTPLNRAIKMGFTYLHISDH